MNLDEYHQDLRNAVKLRADVENDYTSNAFMGEVADVVDHERAARAAAVRPAGENQGPRSVQASDRSNGRVDAIPVAQILAPLLRTPR